jgi:anti-sigma regulatory factor (Ser/Thr protein kinase)/anti-anti-sigma regulatory factor
MIVDVDRDFGTGATFASLAGQLTLATVPNVRTTLHKLAAECPTALILDLRAMAPARESLLAVFAASAQQAGEEYGVPLQVCSCTDDVAIHLRVYRTFLAVHANREAAIAAVSAAGPRWRHLHLEPDVTAAAAARQMVHDACAAWGVGHLDDAARLVVSELVGNAVVHAGTPLDVSAAANGRYLRIAVQDGSRVQPRLVLDTLLAPALAKHGWGLRLVQEHAAHWGSTRTDGGKIVWAQLAVDATPPPSMGGRFTHAG